MPNKYIPRGNVVLVRVKEAGKTKGGLHRPDISADSQRFYAEAWGDKVTGLNKGDEVIFKLGAAGLRLDDDRDLMLVDGDNVICVVERNGDFPEDLAH